MGPHMVVFELRGRMAHFRRIDTNSSSLTYLIPPRTTLIGITAAILGLERDSYYDLLGPDHSWVTVSLKTKVRTIMQTVNNLLVKSPSQLSGSGGHTQVPTEIVVAADNNDWVTYRVFFAHEDGRLTDALVDRLRRSAPAFPISLGTGPMVAKVRLIDVIPHSSVHALAAGVPVSLVTPCLISDIEKIENAGDSYSTEVVKDLMPYSFGEHRTKGWNREFIYERQGLPIAVRLRRQALEVTYGASARGTVREAIMFSEDRGFLHA